MKTDSERRELMFWGMALLFVALASSLPSLSPHHVFEGYDLAFHLDRIEGLKDALLARQFPVRMNPVQLGGYGMPTDIFYPDLFLYLPALLRMLGVPLLTCWQMFLVFASLLTAFAGWWGFAVYLRSWRAGAVAALFYVTALFRFVMAYISAASGAILAMAFLPAALAAIWRMLRDEPRMWLPAVFFSTCVLESHVLTGIMLVLAALGMAVFSFRSFRVPEVRWAAAKAAGFLFLLNLWFYAPLWALRRSMDFPLKQVTHQEINYAMIYPLREGDFYTGSAFLLLLLVLGGLLVWRKDRALKKFCGWCAVSAVFILMMSHPQPWHLLGRAAGALQYPARLTVFPAMFLSIAAAIGFEAVGKSGKSGKSGNLGSRQRWSALLCALVCLAGNLIWLYGYSYSLPPQPRQRQMLLVRRVSTSDYLEHLDRGYSGYRDYMLASASKRWKDDAQLRAKFGDRELHPSDRTVHVSRQGTSFDVQYAAGVEAELQFPIFWYPGYVARDDEGQLLPIRCDEDGQVRVQSPASESGGLHLQYEGFSWFRWTDRISLLGGIGFLCLWYRNRKHCRKGTFV